MLKLVVCAKAVLDPGEADRLRIDPRTRSLPRLDLPLILNPLDRHALEAAFQIKKMHGASIAVLSMGPPPAGNVIRECLALGADEGILLTDPAFAGADAYATAFTLASAIRKYGPADLIICGMSSSDGATEWVGPEIAAILGLPVVTRVRDISEDRGEHWIVKADSENGYRKVRLSLPAVITVSRNLNQPKPLSLSGILRARASTIATWDRQMMDIPAERVGLNGSPTRVADLAPLESGRSVAFLEGTLQEKVERLVQILSEAGAVKS
jgi:electron transfer flavoprotein alpha/beta subunit